MSRSLVNARIAHTIPNLPLAGLDSSQLASGPIRLKNLVTALNTKSERTNDPHFGLRSGKGIRPHRLGPFGLRLVYGRDAKDCLNFLSKYIGAFQQATDFDVEFNGSRSLCKLNYLDNDLGDTRQLLDAQMAFFLSCIGRFKSSGWLPDRVFLRRERPSDAASLEAVFGPHISFEHGFDGFCANLNQQGDLSSRYDPELCAILEQMILLESADWPCWKGVVEAVVEAITKQIKDGSPSIQRTAKQIGMSVRTLQRRLEKEDTDFSRLVDVVRLRLAERRLDEKRQSVTTLAFDLGYSDVAAFSRAFQRWRGVSPQEYMKAAS